VISFFKESPHKKPNDPFLENDEDNPSVNFIIPVWNVFSRFSFTIAGDV
jgi:hypothetical protein